MTTALAVTGWQEFGCVFLSSEAHPMHYSLGEGDVLCGRAPLVRTAGALHDTQTLAMYAGTSADCSECVRLLRAAAMDAAFGGAS